MKVQSNFASKSRQIAKYGSLLKKSILHDAVAAALQEVANISAAKYMAQGTVEEAIGKPAGNILSVRSGRLVGSVVGAWRFSETILPPTVKRFLSGEYRTSSANFGAGKRESIREVSVAGNLIRGIIGSEVEYAAIHEFGGTIKFKKRGGSVRIPARPYLTPAVKDAREDIMDIFKESVEASFKAERI